MIYLICQEWTNTSKNHAGIKYLCNELEKRYPDIYKSICFPDTIKSVSGNFFVRKMKILYGLWLHKKHERQVFNYIKANIKVGDIVILMEYMTKIFPQLQIAQYLKRYVPSIPVYGMIHLVPSIIEKDFPEPQFSLWKDNVDKVFTLGHSLTDYLVNKGYEKTRVVTLFHYVATEYYKPTRVHQGRSTTVIAMGCQMRNTDLLRQIVKCNPTVKFVICQGVNDLSSYFDDCDNVQLIPFVPEDKLRNYMNKSDISLNVMIDTVGSNVIVTSLAMGLAMVCSNVGSISDYCDSSNSILCDNTCVDDFSKAIQLLNNDRTLLLSMQRNSIEKSARLSIEEFHKCLQRNID